MPEPITLLRLELQIIAMIIWLFGFTLLVYSIEIFIGNHIDESVTIVGNHMDENATGIGNHMDEYDLHR